MYLTPEQFQTLMRPLNSTRVAKRSQGGKQLSYLEAYDVKAHLTRIFGFGNWDAEIIHQEFVGSYPYTGSNGPMQEVVWQVTLQLTIHTTRPGNADDKQWMLEEETVYSEAAVGSATGKADSSGVGDLHDNAIKTAASDALKRCAINLGTQFGLSLYNNGSTSEIIKKVLVGEPDGAKQPVDPAKEAALTKTVGSIREATKDDVTFNEQEALLANELGATPVDEPVTPVTTT